MAETAFPLDETDVTSVFICIVVYVDGAPAPELGPPTSCLFEVCALLLDANVSVQHGPDVDASLVPPSLL